MSEKYYTKEQVEEIARGIKKRISTDYHQLNSQDFMLLGWLYPFYDSENDCISVMSESDVMNMLAECGYDTNAE